MTKEALKNQLEQHHKDAYLWTLQCCRYKKEDAEDVLQVVYLKILEKRAKFSGNSSFRTWLFSVIRFTAYDWYKNKPLTVGLEGVRPIEQPAEELFPLNLKGLINQLPARQQQVLLLAFYHEMTLAQIAQVTDLSIGTVRTHYERAKAAMRIKLKVKKA